MYHRMDHVLHSIGRCLLPDSNHLNDIFSNVPDSQWVTQDRHRFLSELGLDDPLESNEHWYWRYCSLVMADHHRLLILDSQTLLCNLWGAIYNAIKRVSASGTPTSNLCLEELLKVRGALQSQLSTAHAPLTKALEIVENAIEDSYLLWSIPLVLDPQYKYRHIEEQFQKTFDCSKATNYTSCVRSMMYTIFYDYSDDDSEDMMAANSSGPLDQAREEQCHPQDDNHATAKTELDDYLEDSPARTTKGFDFDILNGGKFMAPFSTRRWLAWRGLLSQCRPAAS